MIITYSQKVSNRGKYMDKIKYIILIILITSVMFVETANAQSGLWSGCVDKNRGTLFNFQTGLTPIKDCKLDYNISFYDNIFIESLNNKIDILTIQNDNLTNQINMLEYQNSNLSLQVNNLITRNDNLSLQFDIISSKVDNLSNLVPLRNLTDQTGIKNNQNVYQNTDTRGILVMVTIGFPSGGTRAMGISVDSVNPPVIQQTGVLFNNYLGTRDMQTQVTFYVPPGHFYRLDNSGTGAYVIYWWELKF